MKTIQEIKQLVREAEIKAEENLKKEELARREKEKSDLEWEIKNAEETATVFFPDEIEKAAKKGNRKYSIDLNGKLDSRYSKLQMEAINKHLKDFNPVFKEESRTSCEYNYDGNSIDGTDYTYWVVRVYFSW